jgi:uncharacterized RDD family membrane protein YckC
MSEPHISFVPAEARPFQGQTAGLVTRSIAATIDGALVAIALVGTYLGFNALRFLLNPRGFSWEGSPVLLSLALGWCYAVVYLTACWAITGRSYGCHVMGLRVVGRRGRRLRFLAALLRAAFCTFVPIGLFWCGVSRTNRSFQDIFLGTRVVYDWTPRRPLVVPPAALSSLSDEAPAPGPDEAGTSL